MMNKRGFTLLELMIVIIILGVLATTGIMSYQASIERSRGAEARSVIGALRTQCAAYYLEQSNTSMCNNTGLRIGSTTSDQVPSACANTHYFSYAVSGTGAATTGATFVATRCTANGKSPQGKAANTLQLITDFSNGGDTWGGSGGY